MSAGRGMTVRNPFSNPQHDNSNSGLGVDDGPRPGSSNWGRHYESQWHNTCGTADISVLMQLKKYKRNLNKVLDLIRDRKHYAEKADDLEDVKSILEVIGDPRATAHYGETCLKSFYDTCMQLLRKFPEAAEYSPEPEGTNEAESEFEKKHQDDFYGFSSPSPFVSFKTEVKAEPEPEPASEDHMDVESDTFSCSEPPLLSTPEPRNSNSSYQNEQQLGDGQGHRQRVSDTFSCSEPPQLSTLEPRNSNSSYQNEPQWGAGRGHRQRLSDTFSSSVPPRLSTPEPRNSNSSYQNERQWGGGQGHRQRLSDTSSCPVPPQLSTLEPRNSNSSYQNERQWGGGQGHRQRLSDTSSCPVPPRLSTPEPRNSNSSYQNEQHWGGGGQGHRQRLPTNTIRTPAIPRGPPSMVRLRAPTPVVPPPQRDARIIPAQHIRRGGTPPVRSMPPRPVHADPEAGKARLLEKASHELPQRKRRQSENHLVPLSKFMPCTSSTSFKLNRPRNPSPDRGDNNPDPNTSPK